MCRQDPKTKSEPFDPNIIEFIYYCTREEYYELVVEDFEIESAIETWANPYGFNLVYWEREGNDGGYEPKS